MITLVERYRHHAEIVRRSWPHRHTIEMGGGGAKNSSSIRLRIKYMREYRQRMKEGEQ